MWLQPVRNNKFILNISISFSEYPVTHEIDEMYLGFLHFICEPPFSLPYFIVSGASLIGWRLKIML